MYKTRNKNKRRRNTGFKRNHGGGAGKGQKIDIQKFVNKSRKEVEQPPYVNQFAFEDFGLYEELLGRILKKGYSSPTEIQDKVITAIMQGNDVVGIAGTGTGKTAAFLIPIIQDLIESPERNSALIVAPTRELATQIYEEFRSLTLGMNLYASCLIGGEPVNRSLKALSKMNHVIIGTPGRLIDMVERRKLSLTKFRTLVLDEFDRMLDMGFVKDIRKLNNGMICKEQTLLFSATVDGSVKSTIEEVTDEPIEVRASRNTHNSKTIEQDVLYVPKDEKKLDVLCRLLLSEVDPKVILFCETKRKVDMVHRKLRESNIKSDMIHGDKTQKVREKSLNKFKKGHVNVLVATDVVARGIDVDDVSMVINFEVPRNYNDYIHRIGRTGRAGKSGKAITLVD